jgi:hypothetical protein
MNVCALTLEARSLLTRSTRITSISGERSEVSTAIIKRTRFCTGTVKDYIVVYSLKAPSASETAKVPTKTFYWASSQNFIFSSLPEVSAEAKCALKEFECTMFSGEFETVLVESKAAPIVIDAEAGIILPPKHVTELDRLSHTVCQIEQGCSAVPKGALKFTPLQQI